MAEPIRLEPRSTYDRAITHVSNKNVATYSYWLLVECAEELHSMDGIADAIDWVDFNIVGMLGSPDRVFEVHYGDINDND